MPTQHSWALFSGNWRVRGYDQPATCVMKTGSERQKNARMAIQSHERTECHECTHRHMHFSLNLSELYCPSQRWLWRGLFINKQCLNLTYCQFYGNIRSDIFYCNAKSPTQKGSWVSPLKVYGWRISSGPRSKGPKPRAIWLAINSLLQPSLSSLCGTKKPYVWVMKWVKRK